MLCRSLQDCTVSYSTYVTVPERFRKPGADSEGDCSMRLGLARFAAAVKPSEKQSDIELCDLNLTYIEQPAVTPGMLALCQDMQPCLLATSGISCGQLSASSCGAAPLDMLQHDLCLSEIITVMVPNE